MIGARLIRWGAGLTLALWVFAEYVCSDESSGG
ncbi:MAG: hypothetical protein JWO69_2018 [Thermoleophilia bacterium]|nr:hypothetical protein [Thermoleophilia bacterium]